MTALLTSPIIEDATRREFLAAGLLAGCSTEQTTPSTATRTVVHALDAAEVPRALSASL